MGASIWTPSASIQSTINANSTLKAESFLAGIGQSEFTLTKFAYTTGTGSIVVIHNGGVQQLLADYNEIDSVTVRLTFACNAGDTVQVLGFVGISGRVNTPALNQHYQVATAGQMVITVPYEFTPGANMTAIYKDGSRLYVGQDYQETSTTELTLEVALVGGEKLLTVTGLEVNASGTDSGSVGYTAANSGAVATTVKSKLQETLSLKDFGAFCDGVANDTSAVLAAIASIGGSLVTLLIPGATKINAAITFSGNTELEFANGGYFIGTAGTELIQIQSQISAGPFLCFSNCVARATTGIIVRPEWFGAKGDGYTDDKIAIQAAIDFMVNTGGVVQFDARTYAMSSNVNVNGSNTVLSGCGANVTKLKMTADNSCLQILGAAIGTPIRCVVIKDLSITKSVAATGGVGIFAQYSASLKILDVNVADSLYGVWLKSAPNTICERVIVTFSGSANSWRGFNLDTTVGTVASSVFRDCWVDGTQATGTGGIGFNALGSYVSDLLFDACETTTMAIGYQFDCTASAVNGNEDVQLINCRADGIKSIGIYINGAGSVGSPDSMFSIIGGWFNGKSMLAETDSIFLNNSRGVVLENVQFYNDANYAWGYHVKMAGCSNVIVNACHFVGMKYGVYMTSTGYSVINGNRFWCQSGRTATQYVCGIGCARVMVNNNVFDGYANNAIVFDGTSSGCGIVGNSANVTNISAPRFSNSSTGPIGGSDGSTGLNSGY